MPFNKKLVAIVAATTAAVSIGGSSNIHLDQNKSNTTRLTKNNNEKLFSDRKEIKKSSITKVLDSEGNEVKKFARDMENSFASTSNSYEKLNKTVTIDINKEATNNSQAQPITGNVATAFLPQQAYMSLNGIKFYSANPEAMNNLSLYVENAQGNVLSSGTLTYVKGTGGPYGNGYLEINNTVPGQTMPCGVQTLYLSVYGDSAYKPISLKVNVIPLSYFVQTVAVPGLVAGQQYSYQVNGSQIGYVTAEKGTGKNVGKTVVQVCANDSATITFDNDSSLAASVALASNVSNLKYTKNVSPIPYTSEPWYTIGRNSIDLSTPSNNKPPIVFTNGSAKVTVETQSGNIIPNSTVMINGQTYTTNSADK